eukprot:scaffold96812_cov63-Phaeocystis_antarctica.AAC.1
MCGKVCPSTPRHNRNRPSVIEARRPSSGAGALGARALGAGALGARRLALLSTRGDGAAPLRCGVGNLGV